MVRKEVVVAILALAIGALGCGDDSAGAGGAGGAGGTAGVGGTGGVGGMGGGGLTTACIDEPDLSAATSIEFSGQFWGCYDTADMDIVASVDSCLQETPGLSGGCSDCYGEYAGCMRTRIAARAATSVGPTPCHAANALRPSAIWASPHAPASPLPPSSLSSSRLARKVLSTKGKDPSSRKRCAFSAKARDQGLELACPLCCFCGGLREDEATREHLAFVLPDLT